MNHFEEKAAFVPEGDLYSFATPETSASEAVAQSDIVDLTSKMQPDGTLDWTPPAGDWVILRFGYSLLGITNHPATAEATGLEVDKLDHTFVKSYMEKYLDSYKQTVGPDFIGKRGIRSRGRQTGPQVCEKVLRHVSGQLQRDSRRRLHGQERHPLRDQR